MKTTKKTLSLILAILMIFTCIPVSAGAIVLPKSPTDFDVYPGPDYVELAWDETAIADGYRVFIRIIQNILQNIICFFYSLIKF